MKRLGSCALPLLALVSVILAQPSGRANTAPADPSSPAVSLTPRQVLATYCVECHGQDKPEAGISIERLLGQLSLPAIGEQGNAWENVAEMLESRRDAARGCGAVSDRRGA